ncbi:hypothetical protein DL95DRAFT_381886 [Leptodontidium sp. 2 PMI_412]|nr:hypothetical protein DL95DRAFT_381886 [Leptodontidium sp. 2 PMI_412]
MTPISPRKEIFDSTLSFLPSFLILLFGIPILAPNMAVTLLSSQSVQPEWTSGQHLPNHIDIMIHFLYLPHASINGKRQRCKLIFKRYCRVIKMSTTSPRISDPCNYKWEVECWVLGVGCWDVTCKTRHRARFIERKS